MSLIVVAGPAGLARPSASNRLDPDALSFLIVESSGGRGAYPLVGLLIPLVLTAHARLAVDSGSGPLNSGGVGSFYDLTERDDEIAELGDAEIDGQPWQFHRLTRAGLFAGSIQRAESARVENIS